MCSYGTCCWSPLPSLTISFFRLFFPLSFTNVVVKTALLARLTDEPAAHVRRKLTHAVGQLAGVSSNEAEVRTAGEAGGGREREQGEG